MVQTKCGNLMELVNRLVRQFAEAFNTRLSVPFHVVAPSSDGFENLVICTCADCSLSYPWSKNDTGSSKSTIFCNCAHIFDKSWVVPAIFMSSTYTDKKNCSLRWRCWALPPIPILLQSGLSRISSPVRVQPMDDRKRLRSSGTTGSSLESRCCGLLAFGNMIQICGQSSSERWGSSGASFISTCEYALAASFVLSRTTG